jgi:hypothetical protein
VRRLKLFLAAIALPAPAPDEAAQQAFAALARVQLAALATGQGRWMERLVDWLDATDADDHFHDAKQRSYIKVMDFLETQIAQLAARTGVTFAEPTGLAPFWLDGIVGHSRTTTDLTTADIDAWAQRYAAMFLKAVA